jgi:hypothetical protein
MIKKSRLISALIASILITMPLFAFAKNCNEVEEYLPNTTKFCEAKGISFAGMGWSCVSSWLFTNYAQSNDLKTCVTMLNSHQKGQSYPWGDAGLIYCSSGDLKCRCDFNNGAWSCAKY